MSPPSTVVAPLDTVYNNSQWIKKMDIQSGRLVMADRFGHLIHWFVRRLLTKDCVDLANEGIADFWRTLRN